MRHGVMLARRRSTHGLVRAIAIDPYNWSRTRLNFALAHFIIGVSIVVGVRSSHS